MKGQAGAATCDGGSHQHMADKVRAANDLDETAEGAECQDDDKR